MLTLPLWSFLAPQAVMNAGILFAFWISAFGMYRLVRELTADRLVALCAGILFAAVPYHMAHVQAHQHLLPMGWVPLYLVYVHRMLENRARWRDAALGGLFLGLASLASWYHLLFALVLTPIVALAVPIRQLVSRRLLAQASVLAAAFLGVAGPLLFGVLYAKSVESISGAHDPVRFSADLEAFFFPNFAQGWSGWWGRRAAHWSGNVAENGLYAGYSLLAAAAVGAALAGRKARVYLSAALAGALLAMGPCLHVAGRVFPETKLPYALLEKALPQIEFMGVPVRLGYVMYLGLVVAAALGLAELRRRISHSAVRATLALGPAALTLVEYFPRPFIECPSPVPRPMAEWAKEPRQFAVLDLTDDYRMLWHATVHRKPLTGGNLTRVPARLEDWYWNLPIIRGLKRPALAARQVLVRVDQEIDFAWGNLSPAPQLRSEQFRIEWRGTLRIPRAGRWTFFLTSDDGSWLDLDGSRVLDNGGIHPPRERSTTVELTEAVHSVVVSYEQAEGGASMRFEWSGPDQPRQVVPRNALNAVDASQGLTGTYFQAQEGCGFERAHVRASTRAIGIRYIVTGLGPQPCLSSELALPRIYQGEGVRDLGSSRP